MSFARFDKRLLLKVPKRCLCLALPARDVSIGGTRGYSPDAMSGHKKSVSLLHRDGCNIWNGWVSCKNVIQNRNETLSRKLSVFMSSSVREVES